MAIEPDQRSKAFPHQAQLVPRTCRSQPLDSELPTWLESHSRSPTASGRKVCVTGGNGPDISIIPGDALLL